MLVKTAEEQLTEKVTRELLDRGKIIAAGWTLFRSYVIPKDAPPIQIQEMEKAFFAGAQHLWGSIMTGLDEDTEPTVEDERRMELIGAELQAFGERLKAEGRPFIAATPIILDHMREAVTVALHTHAPVALNDHHVPIPSLLGPVCRVCLCSEDDACANGCAWAEPDLCTACAAQPAPPPPERANG